MIRAEQSVERVLAGLREAEAPAGMEQRVLRAMEERAAVGVRRGRSAGLLAGWAVACAVVAVVVVVALGPGMRRVEAPGQQGVSSSQVSGPAASVRSSPGGSAVDARPVRADAESRAPVKVRRVAVRRAKAPGSVREVRAASRPAPLTHEEKLLLQVARMHDPKALELLNAEIRSQQEMEAKAEFDRFFAGSGQGSAPTRDNE